MNVPNSIEMGVYPFVSDSESGLNEFEELVETAGFGPVKVNIYGVRGKYPIVTFHDIGMNAVISFENFFQYQTSSKLTELFCVYNINAPGQEMGAKKLPSNYQYPTMDDCAKIIGDVGRHFGIKSFIGIGIGAGANVFLRYSKLLNFLFLVDFCLEKLNDPLLDALVLINATSEKAGWIEWFYQKWNLNNLRSERMTQFTVDYLMWHHFGRHIDDCNPDIIQQYRSYFYNHSNPWNLRLFLESFLNRNKITLRDPKSTTDFLLNVPVLQIVGANSAFIGDSVNVNSQLNPKFTEWLKISDSCGLVMDDKPLKVTQAFLLFLQGLGFCSSLNVSKLVNEMKGTGCSGGGFGLAIESVNE